MGHGSRRRLGGVGALLLAAALIALSWTVGGLATRGWELAGGLAALTVALVLLRAGTIAALFAGLFTILGGVSAVVATRAPHPFAGSPLPRLSALGVVSEPATGAVSAFHYALRVTTAAALAACVVAAAVTVLLRRRPALTPGHRQPPAPPLVERLGQALCVLGLIGFALAFVRFLFVGADAPTLFGQLKSFWKGGSYLLLLAGFAIPGIGLWLSAALERRDLRSVKACAAVATVLALLSVPTGQRGFSGMIALVVIAVLLDRGVIARRALAGLAAAAVVALGATQAIRNAAREEGSVTVGSIAGRLAPDRWPDLYGSQFESFRWTWDVAHYRSRLDLPGPLRSLISKPVPRGLSPSKTQGFASDFTRQLYPEAAAEEVGFATPLVAEVDYAWGPAGVILVLAGFAALLAWLWERFRSGAAVLRPVLLTAVAWCCLLYVRGDVANATFVAAAWIIPLAAVLAVLRLQPDRLTTLLLSDGARLRKT